MKDDPMPGQAHSRSLRGESAAASTGSLAMAVQHLNVPTGPVVKTFDLALALQSGSFDGVPSPGAAAAMAYLFVEIDPCLVAACMREAGGSFASANRLYLETVHAGIPRVPAWEQALEHLL